jgi:hypothetical protein
MDSARSLRIRAIATLRGARRREGAGIVSTADHMRDDAALGAQFLGEKLVTAVTRLRIGSAATADATLDGVWLGGAMRDVEQALLATQFLLTLNEMPVAVVQAEFGAVAD